MQALESTASVSATSANPSGTVAQQQQAATHSMPVDVTRTPTNSDIQSDLAKRVAALGLGEWYIEKIHHHWGQAFHVVKWLVVEKSEHQELLIFENEIFGRVLVLDGAIQITEKDEYVYQEMMTHIPLLSHPNPKKVLIIGGGDGGILREVLRYKSVEKAYLCEIDGTVITRSRELLPFISECPFNDKQLSFDNPRSKIVIENGCKFVKETPEKFDVIICDSTDPKGCGEVLFTPQFYGDCHKLLTEGGIFVNQNGVPYLQGDELKTYHSRRMHFQDVGFYVASVPTYAGGHMTLGWATDAKELREVSVQVLEKRLKENVTDYQNLRYYTPELHKGCFALPSFIKQKLLTLNA